MATMEKTTQVAEVQAITEGTETPKWNIRVYHRRRGGEFIANVRVDHEGSLIGEVYTDAETLPKRVDCGDRRYELIFTDANYVVYKKGKAVTMIVDTSKDVEIKTGNEELDELLNELKVPEDKKFEVEPKKAFAKRCGEMAAECGVPFEIAMSFGGHKKDIVRFKQSFKKALEQGKFSEKVLGNFKKDISETEAQTLLMLLKIYTGESKTCARIAKAVYRMVTQN